MLISVDCDKWYIYNMMSRAKTKNFVQKDTFNVTIDKSTLRE